VVLYFDYELLHCYETLLAPEASGASFINKIAIEHTITCHPEERGILAHCCRKRKQLVLLFPSFTVVAESDASFVSMTSKRRYCCR